MLPPALPDKRMVLVIDDMGPPCMQGSTRVLVSSVSLGTKEVWISVATECVHSCLVGLQDFDPSLGILQILIYLLIEHMFDIVR